MASSSIMAQSIEEIKAQEVTDQMNLALSLTESEKEKVYKIGLELGSIVQSGLTQTIGNRDLVARVASGDVNAKADLERKAEEQREAGRDLTGNVIRADKAIYQEQCFLLSQLTSLIALKRKNHIPRLPYVPAVSTVRGTSEKEGAEQKTEPINSNAPILIYDEPFGDSSAIQTCLICELSGKEIKVVLSGDGVYVLFGL